MRQSVLKSKRTTCTNGVRGFTLIELLIVIVILGLLYSLVAPAMFSKVDSTKVKSTQIQLEMLRTSMEAYRLDLGSYPETLEQLRVSSGAGWDGPYLPKSVPKDAWGNDYYYQVPGDSGQAFVLKSFGKDGAEGGTGDAEDILYQE